MSYTIELRQTVYDAMTDIAPKLDPLVAEFVKVFVGALDEFPDQCPHTLYDAAVDGWRGMDDLWRVTRPEAIHAAKNAAYSIATCILTAETVLGPHICGGEEE